MLNLLRSVSVKFFLSQSTNTHAKLLNISVENIEPGPSPLQLTSRLLSNQFHGVMLMYPLSKLLVSFSAADLLGAQETQASLQVSLRIITLLTQLVALTATSLTQAFSVLQLKALALTLLTSSRLLLNNSTHLEDQLMTQNSPELRMLLR
jgi:hypothetical protein